jgi:hypothetical protein
MQEMSDQASPSARINPVVFTALLVVALTSTALIGASLGGVASGAVQDLLRIAGFGQNSAFAAEQRRQAQVLEAIELSVGGMRAEVALLNVRLSEAESLYREAVNAAPARPAQINPAQVNPVQFIPAQVIPVQSTDPDFELAALRASFDGTIDERLDARRQNPHERRWRGAHAERGAAAIRARTTPSA